MPEKDSGPIARFYDAIAGRYELVNGFLTLGLDGLWRRKAVSFIPAGARPLEALDACCGTGDMTGLLSRRLPAGSRVRGADFNAAMLALARAKLPGVKFTESPASALPFPDGSFDIVTVSFATRNLASSPEGLRASLIEFLRVLRPGGTFLQLESSVPASPFVRFFFRLYVRAMISLAAALLPRGSRAAYRYLGSSVLTFMDADAMSRELLAAGFRDARYERLFPGAVAVHIAVK